MKNFKLIMVILTLFVSNMNAQTVGDHLNRIRKQEPDGEFDYNPKGGSTYKVVDEENTLWIYFFNIDLKCIGIATHPTNSKIFQAFVELFNRDWVVMDDTHWKFYRNNGTILKANIDVVDNVGSVIYISE